MTSWGFTYTKQACLSVLDGKWVTSRGMSMLKKSRSERWRDGSRREIEMGGSRKRVIYCVIKKYDTVNMVSVLGEV